MEGNGDASVGAGGWDVLRLRACPGCDYSLEALPAEGVCPECGRGYDQRYVVLNGRGRGRFDTVLAGTWRGVVATVVGLGVVLWMLEDAWYSRGDPVVIVFLAAGGFGLAAQVFARVFSGRPVGMQLWVSAEGVRQVVSTAEGRAVQSAGVGALNGLVLLMAVVMLIVRQRRAGWVELGMYAMWAALGGVGLERWWRRRRKEIEEGPVPRMWAWGMLSEVVVKELGKGRVRVRCRRPNRWGRVKVSEEWVVDVEVECGAEGAGELRRRIDGWSGGLLRKTAGR